MNIEGRQTMFKWKSNKTKLIEALQQEKEIILEELKESRQEAKKLRKDIDALMFKSPIVTIRDDSVKVVCKVQNRDSHYPVELMKMEITRKIAEELIPFMQYDMEMENGIQVMTGSLYVVRAQRWN